VQEDIGGSHDSPRSFACAGELQDDVPDSSTRAGTETSDPTATRFQRVVGEIEGWLGFSGFRVE
jgi:hypothetical protein